jgi:hypothetical protein
VDIQCFQTSLNKQDLQWNALGLLVALLIVRFYHFARNSKPGMLRGVLDDRVNVLQEIKAFFGVTGIDRACEVGFDLFELCAGFLKALQCLDSGYLVIEVKLAMLL